MTLDVIALTQKIIQCPSVTPADAGAQDVLKQPLKDLGFEIFDLPFDGDGSYPVKNFFARLGNDGPHLCYAGHTDVVPTGDENAWTHTPFDAVIDNGVMYGRGTSDMKGANVAFLVAASRFLKTKPNFKGSISMLITGDEEADAINGTVKVLDWMSKNKHTPDTCLVGESSNVKTLGEEIKIGRRGSLSGTLTVTGKQGHVAYPQFANNPLPILAKMAAAISDFTFDKGTGHFPPTNLQITTIDTDNLAGNVIPAEGHLKFNIRFNTHWTMETLDKKLREILNDVEGDYTLQTGGNALPFITEPGDWTSLVQNVVQKHTNQTPELTTGGGTSDARFIAQYCPVVEFGLTNETIHQIDENLKISDLEKLVKIYEDILHNYFK